MKRIQTKEQLQASASPKKMDVLKELAKRKALDETLTAEYQRLKTGDRGEQIVLKALEEFGQPH